MTKKIKVLHLLQSRKFSGAENVVTQIVNMFKDEDIEFLYCSPDGPIKEEIRIRNIPFCPLKKINIQQVKKVVKSFNPDVIHAHDVTASVIAAIVGGKATVISHMHVNNQSMNGINLKSFLYLLCSIKFKHIIWVSKSSFEGYIFKKHISQKSSILYNVINKDLLYKNILNDSKQYNFDVVFIGRITYQKNPERLIEILNLTIKNNKGLKVAIVGNGELLGKAKKLVLDYGLEKNINFLGYQKNPHKILKSAKVLVMSSRFEGTPMVALEAMALGVPIVNTPVDGLKDLVINGKNGYLSDDNHILANKINSILKDDKLYKRLSAGAEKRFLEINNIQNYKTKIWKIYSKAIE